MLDRLCAFHIKPPAGLFEIIQAPVALRGKTGLDSPVAPFIHIVPESEQNVKLTAAS